MAPPVPKRRKLKHQEDDTDGSDVSLDSPSAGSLSDERPGNPQSSFDNTFTDEESLGGEEASTDADSADENETIASSKTGPKAFAAPVDRNVSAAKSRMRPASDPRDGVYTAEIYRSNIFKLQVDDLLEQMRPKYGKKDVEGAMRAVKEIIEKLPARDPMPLIEAEQSLRAEGIVVPFPDPPPPKDIKYKFQYDPPSHINVTGSYPMKLAIRTDHCLTIDLVVTMPSSIFQEKDYLNYRYFYKRAFYLGCIAAGIKSSAKDKFKLCFDSFHDNQLQPVLLVKSGGNDGLSEVPRARYAIRILLALPQRVFTPARLLPTSNCVRPKDSNDNVESRKLEPTPFYNATLQSDALVTPYLKLIHDTIQKFDAFRDACILGRIWLRQRGFGSQLSRGGFGNFEWTAMMALLMQPGTGGGAPWLSAGYSSYQLFKGALQFLAKHDLGKSAFTFQASNIDLPKGDCAPVCFDAPRTLNILFKMTRWSYRRLQAEANTTIEMLATPISDHFESTFISKIDNLQYRFDALIEMPISALSIDDLGRNHTKALTKVTSKIYELLYRALTDRVSLITFNIPYGCEWALANTKPSIDGQRSIVISLATDPTNANRAVDHGPSAEEKKSSASFRQFWGEKAELRRFKDGSILESVLWPMGEGSLPVPEQIVRYILGRHLCAQAGLEAKYSGDSFARVISSGRVQNQSNVSAFSSRMNAFTSLERDIRGLDGLPLQIRTIAAADPLLRYAAVDPDSKHLPAAVVLQFEGSARWPDDLCAIQRTKVAFLLKLADLLEARKSSFFARLGLENPSQPAQNQAYLDIFSPSGYAFRFRIHHDREATLLERQLKDKSLDAPSREAAAEGLALYKRDYIHSPAHTQMLQTLSTRFPALSPSIRLTKRWFAAHLLTSHFAPELIELLVVRTFLQHHPWPVPSCATTGFLRTLLFLSRWDWRHVPLIVDLSAGTSSQIGTGPEDPAARNLKPEDVENCRTRFEAWRKIDPAMNRVVLFVASNLDREGTIWTDMSKPEKVVAARMTALAKSATSLIEAQEEKVRQQLHGVDPGLETPEKDDLVERLFTPQLQDFDVVIRLSPKALKTARRAESTFKNVQLQQDGLGTKDSQNVGFDPVHLFTKDLRAMYGDAILWFWDIGVSNVICGLFNPIFVGPRHWKVKADWNSSPRASKDGRNADGETENNKKTIIHLNKEAILNEILRVGGEMIATLDIGRNTVSE